METKTAAIEMRNITKRFGPVLANDKVWLNIYRGDPHICSAKTATARRRL